MAQSFSKISLYCPLQWKRNCVCVCGEGETERETDRQGCRGVCVCVCVCVCRIGVHNSNWLSKTLPVIENRW